MHVVGGVAPIFAFLNLSDDELVLIATALAILFVATRVPELMRGIRFGFKNFRDATDELAHDAGRSVGGIHGKPATEALTPDNRVTELYNPTVLKKKPQAPKQKKRLIKRVFSTLPGL